MIRFFKNSFLAFFLILFSSIVLKAQNKKDFWIDRFDKANSKTLTKGEWYTYSDKTRGGGSIILPNYKKAPSGEMYYEFSYSLQKENWQFTPYAAIACKVSGKQIPTGVQAIAYDFKGSEHSFIFLADNIKDYANYLKVIPASNDWTTVIIPIAALRQPNWGQKVRFSAEDLNGFSWQIDGKSNDSGKVAFDNVRLLYTPQHVISKNEDNNITIAQTEVFHSKLMDEDRGLSIYLPASITEMRESGRTYPVIYLLDGDAHINSVGSMVQALGPRLGSSALPEMIIIGIHNTNRWRDLSPSHSTKTPFGRTTINLSATGGGEKFMDYIEKELIPHIDSAYPTSPFRILIGHSLGGLTVINTLIHRPNLFSDYLAIDPSLWWNDQLLNKQAAASLDTMKLNNKQLFIATANTVRPGVDTNLVKSDTSRYSLALRSIFDFTNILKNHPRSGLQWKNVYYEDDDHMSVPVIASYDGLRYFFDYHRISFNERLESPNFNIDSAYTQHYNVVSNKLGYKVTAPEDMINWMGHNYLQNKEHLKIALTYFQMNVRNYPNSTNAYISLGEYYEKVGDLNNAIENYKKALAISEWSHVRTKLDRLEARKIRLEK